ncbi:MAG: efflux RND transporter periplasmic adaptor subunit [Planctomycetota bacterium]
MLQNDISKLKIDKTRTMQHRRAHQKTSVRIAGAAFLLLLGFVLYRLAFDPVVTVKVATVSQMYPAQAFTLLHASGYVVAQRKAAVASKATGRLVWLGVEEGSTVTKGQTIARLECEDAVAVREQAMANLNGAVSNLVIAKTEMDDAGLHHNRQRELRAQGIVAQSEFDVAEARYKRACAAVISAEATIAASRAALHAAKVSLKYTFIRAPFDAVVLTKNADIGDIVTPLGAGANAIAGVVTIADMSSLLVEADVSESNLRKVKAGQPCEIQLDAIPDVRFRGMVYMIVPTADRSKASVMVKVKFLEKDPRVLPEMSAKVAFLEKPVTAEEQRPRVVLNKGIMISRDGQQAVFLIKENRAIETPITTGAQLGDMIEIVAGVAAGEQVVVNPPGRLKNRARIKIKDNE